IEFAQADIMNLGSIGRRFDKIEVIGVLHHLVDPLAGWRILLSLLRPGGGMNVGLYSVAARKAIKTAAAIRSEAGHAPAPGGARVRAGSSADAGGHPRVPPGGDRQRLSAPRARRHS